MGYESRLCTVWCGVFILQKKVYAIILAAGVGQRMRNTGLPKQFLKINGKPIIVYTLEKFEEHTEISGIVIVCKEGYLEHMQMFTERYHIAKVKKIMVGGKDRQSSLYRGLQAITDIGGTADDVVIIHDGVRPLVSTVTINENIRVATESGAAMTVHPVTETVVVTGDDDAQIDHFQKRDETYSLTSPQSFRLGGIMDAYGRMFEEEKDGGGNGGIPLLDAAMVYARYMGEVPMVKDSGTNIKITTPEDFYILRSMFEMEENKFIFGL